jgi:C4-type Zn-finger protein
MPKKRKDEVIESSGNSGHPERDQFIEGKIGSGYMSTIEGQPHLEQFADVVSKDGKKEVRDEPASRSRNTNQK